uniref:Uncharacterized protein n=1 Tax=Oryza meridionalis TaxID=40149 RepID=A0A0E0EEL4_9ORYZ
MADEVSNVGEETTGNEEVEGKKTTTKKKLRKWRMPQEQIDRILSRAPLPFPRPLYREDLAASEAEKEALRQMDAYGAEAVRHMNEYRKEQQEWVKAELAAHGYVEWRSTTTTTPASAAAPTPVMEKN